jgi:transcriptional regulator with XRE-family HTH domain
MNLPELGAFLRSRRDRVRPAEVGLTTTSRRRVAGLRRDEVAELAHVSTDYYIEIERGTAQPSSAVLVALADALRMSRDERDHLFTLAQQPHPHQRNPTPTRLLPAMRDLLGRFGPDVPAYVTTDLQIILAQNTAAAELHGPLPAGTGPGDSYVYRWFTDPAVRARFERSSFDAEADALIADLRISVARRSPTDPDTTTLIARLSEESSWFASLWARQDVAIRRNEPKRLIHPQHGPTDYNSYALLSDDNAQRVIWYAPSGRSRSRPVATNLTDH